MSNDRYEKIRKALEMGPTPGPWSIRETETHVTVIGSDNEALFHDDKRIPRVAADARLIAACDPDTIRKLLDERDALKTENEKLREALKDANDEVVFIDGVGAGRSSVKSCHGGVQWIRVGDRVYWPLSESDAKRLQSACCGNRSFDGPTMPAVEGVNND